MYRLTKGRHIITLICVGKEQRSVGYNLGINDVVIERVSDQPEPTLEAPRCASTKAGPLFRGCPLSFYVTRIQTGSQEERLAAIRAAGYFGADAAPAVGELAAALSDADANVREAAGSGASQIGPPAETAVPALAKALSDSNPRVRDLAAIALGSMGAKAARAIPELVKALNDSVDYVRAPAADALGAIGPGAQAAVKPLAEKLLTDDQGFVLGSVAYALGDIGPNAKDALPALEQVLKMRRVGSAAEEAILKIEGYWVPSYH